MKTSAPLTPKLDDVKAEQARRVHEEKISELASKPSAGLAVLQAITLADAVATTIPHKLGRTPIWISPSPPRNASTTGRIEEIRGTVDRAKYIVLKATGWGATITVDIAVM